MAFFSLGHTLLTEKMAIRIFTAVLQPLVEKYGFHTGDLRK